MITIKGMDENDNKTRNISKNTIIILAAMLTLSLIANLLVVVYKWDSIVAKFTGTNARGGIERLTGSITDLDLTANNSTGTPRLLYESDTTSCKDINNIHDDCNLLFIGNSISLHGIVDVWKGQWGMSATEKNKDYVHVLVDHLSEIYDVNYTVCTAYDGWETPIISRSEAMKVYDPFLSDDLDYIIVQFGENVDFNSKFEKEFFDLLTYFHEHSDKAEIVVVGNFWEDVDVEAAKVKAAADVGAIYVDLSDTWGNEIYEAGVGYEVQDAMGRKYAIKSEGVAAHPGDLGMKMIGERIFDAIITSME